MSIVPSTMFVHVRWSRVSIEYSFWIISARSRLLSWVVPPAPQVTLTPMGLSADMRDTRVSKLAKPCVRAQRSALLSERHRGCSDVLHQYEGGKTRGRRRAERHRAERSCRKASWRSIPEPRSATTSTRVGSGSVLSGASRSLFHTTTMTDTDGSLSLQAIYARALDSASKAFCLPSNQQDTQVGPSSRTVCTSFISDAPRNFASRRLKTWTSYSVAYKSFICSVRMKLWRSYRRRTYCT